MKISSQFNTVILQLARRIHPIHNERLTFVMLAVLQYAACCGISKFISGWQAGERRPRSEQIGSALGAERAGSAYQFLRRFRAAVGCAERPGRRTNEAFWPNARSTGPLVACRGPPLMDGWVFGRNPLTKSGGGRGRRRR